MTVCLYLPDRTVGFMFQRPEIKDNNSHDAGGAKFEVIKPFEHHRIRYSGKVCILKNPLEMADPAAAFKNNPYASAQLELDYRATSPEWGGELREKTDAGWVSPQLTGNAEQQFATGHFEQLGHATGTLVLSAKGGGNHELIEGQDSAITLGSALLAGAQRLSLADDELRRAPAGWPRHRQSRWQRGQADSSRKGEPNLNIVKVNIETDFAASSSPRPIRSLVRLKTAVNRRYHRSDRDDSIA